MAESQILIRDLKLPDSEDFYHLREKGMEYIEDLGHKIWTDYNLHDPGITILELFCYALTDLGYRTGHLMKDILTREIDGVPTSMGRFHTAREIFSCNPVTFDDLRQLMVDIRGVRNAWVLIHDKLGYDLCVTEPVRLLMPDEAATAIATAEANGTDSPVIPIPPLNGLYEVLIEYEEFVKELKVGVDNIACVKGRYIPPEGKGLSVEIYTDLVIREVSIYAENNNEITLNLLDESGTVIETYEHTPVKTYRKEYIEVNLCLNYIAGQENIYHLVIEGEGASLFAHSEPAFSEGEGFLLDGYLKLLGGYVPGQTDPVDKYYFLYDWEIEMPEVLGESLVTKREHVGLDNPSQFTGKVVKPKGEGIVFDANCPLTLESFCLNFLGSGKVDVNLYDESGKLVECTTLDLKNTGKSPVIQEVFVNWDIPACQGYQLTATSDKVSLFMNEEAEFPYFVPGVIILLGNEDAGGLTQQYNYFYDWVVSFQQKNLPNLADEELTSSHVKEEIRRKLREHRNLCEDLIKVKPVENEEIGLYADIEFTGEQAEEVIAEIFCLMEEYVKPPVRYYTWQQLMERGYTADQVFSGPLMEHGFVDPEEFAKTRRKTELRVSDIVQLIMEIPEIKQVRNIYLTSFIDGRLAKKEPWILCLENDDCLAPNFNPDRSGLSLYRTGIPYQCNHEKVEELLLEKSLRNRPSKLKKHELDCVVPVGEDQLLEDFYPMQNDLPITYMVGEVRVPDSEPPIRHAQSRQLKAFLMFFEQMLANFLSQLEHLPDLFSWDLAGPERDDIHTYFAQVVGEITDLEDIYFDHSSLSDLLSQLAETPEEARDRKNEFLNHLLARFAEDFSTYGTLMYALFTSRKEAALRLIEDKQLFLKYYPDVSRNRGQGIDFTYQKEYPELSGFQRRIYRKLGMYVRENTYLGQDSIVAFRESGKGWYFQVKDENGTYIFKSRYMPDRDALDNLIDVAIYSGKSKINYALTTELEGCQDESGKWTLLAPCSTAGDREIIGTVSGHDDAILNTLIYIFTHFNRSVSFQQPLDLAFRPLTNDNIQILSETKSDKGPWYFVIQQEKEGQKQVIFQSKSCESRFFIEELLEETFKVGASWENYTFNEQTCAWDLFACPGEEKSLMGSTSGLFYRKTMIDLLNQICHAEGMHMIEHILLRPRVEEDSLMTVRHHQVDVATASTYDESSDNEIFVTDPYSFRMTLVLPAWSYRFRNLQFRRFAEDLIRLEAPAHVYPNIYWISFAQMQRFEPVYLNWLKELGRLPVKLNGTHPLADLDEYENYHRAHEALISVMEELKIIYPQARIYDPASQETGKTQPTLGNMSLGQI